MNRVRRSARTSPTPRVARVLGRAIHYLAVLGLIGSMLSALPAAADNAPAKDPPTTGGSSAQTSQAPSEPQRSSEPPGQAKKSDEPAPVSQPAQGSQAASSNQSGAQPSNPSGQGATSSGSTSPATQEERKPGTGNGNNSPEADCYQNDHYATNPEKGGANQSGAYDANCIPAPSGNGRGDGDASGKPYAGTVGQADNKNPPGQAPDGTDRNAGYECDRNQGVGQTNPAHTGCTATPTRTPGPSPTPTANASSTVTPPTSTPEVTPTPTTPGGDSTPTATPGPTEPTDGDDDDPTPTPSPTPGTPGPTSTPEVSGESVPSPTPTPSPTAIPPAPSSTTVPPSPTTPSGTLGITDDQRGGNPPEQDVVICHATGSSEHPFKLIVVNPEDLAEHLAHGDMPGVTAPEECHAPAGVFGVTSEVPAAPVPLVAQGPLPVPQPQSPPPTAPAPPARATVGLLPTTGEPLIDLSLIALAITAVMLVGLRLVRLGTRRA